METEKGSFTCPECSSRDAALAMAVETEPGAPEPWASVLDRIVCGGCRSVVPAHLGERWGGISVEAARTEWADKYRKDNRLYGDDGGDEDESGDSDAEADDPLG